MDKDREKKWTAADITYEAIRIATISEDTLSKEKYKEKLRTELGLLNPSLLLDNLVRDNMLKVSSNNVTARVQLPQREE